MVGTLSRTKFVTDEEIIPLSVFSKTSYKPTTQTLIEQSQLLVRRTVGLKDQTLLDCRTQEVAEQIEERARKLIESYQRGYIDLKTFEQHKKEILGAAAAIGLTLLILTNFNPKVKVNSQVQPLSFQPKTEVIAKTSPTIHPKLIQSSVNKTNRAAMLRVIRFAEGTADERGYYRLFGGREIESLERHPDICIKFGRTCSTAVGAYQFLTTTWESLKLPDFSPTNQDKGAIELIRRRGALADVDAGRFEVAIGKLSPEWASLPRWEGDPAGTYNQPVKTMRELREVYLEHGGKLADQVKAKAPTLPIAKHKPNNLISYFFGNSKKAEASVNSHQQDLAQKIVGYMERQGYEITRNPQEVNIVHIRNGNAARDRFEDKRIILQFDVAGRPQIIGEWGETTKPGLHVVRTTPRRDGAIFISEGQYKSWQVGVHYGMTGKYAHEALIQVAPINGMRDSNRDGTPDNPVQGNFGVNIHGPWSDGNQVEDRSAGCMVTATMRSHREFMEIVKRDRRYQTNNQFVFTATIIDSSKL